MTLKRWRLLLLPVALSAAVAAAGNASLSVGQRSGHSAILLRDGRVMLVGGRDQNANLLSAVDIFDPWSGWEPRNGASSNPTFDQPVATLLPDGRVLVVAQGAKIYDVNTNAWRDVNASLQVPMRAGHTLTVLQDGRVLLLGGFEPVSGAAPPQLGQIFPDAGFGWLQLPSTATAMRVGHTATLLKDGRVLISGGTSTLDGGDLGTLGVYDPLSSSFATLDAGVVGTRSGHTATRRSNGQVMLLGDAQAVKAFVEVDVANGGPSANITTTNPTGINIYNGHSAAMLPNGDLVVTGGYASVSGTTSVTTVYRLTVDGTWLVDPILSVGRAEHASTVLTDGKLLVTGGTYTGPLQTWQVLDPIGFNFSRSTATMPSRVGATATPLPTGDVLLVGGYGAGPGEALVRMLVDGVGTVMSSAIPLRVKHTATLITSDEVLVLGGMSPTGPERYSDCWLVNIYSGASRPCPSMPAPRFGHTATMLPDGRVLVTGGRSATGQQMATAWVFDPGPGGGTWLQVGNLQQARVNHAAVLLPDGRVLVTGGEGGLDSTEVFVSIDAGFRSGPPLTVGRSNHTLSLLRDGRVMLAGGFDDQNQALDSVEFSGPDGGMQEGLLAMSEPRAEHAAVVLPTGDVVLVGGTDAGPNTTADRWSPLDESFASPPGALYAARRSPGLVLGLRAEVMLMGGSLGPAPFEFERVPVGSTNLLTQSLIANFTTVSQQTGAFRFTLSSNWRGGSEASSGDGRNSSVAWPRLLLQRIENGQVVVPAYQFDAASGVFTGNAPNLAQGHWRAWAYIGGNPGTGAWFKVGTRTTVVDGGVPPLDAGVPDGGPVGVPGYGISVNFAADNSLRTGIRQHGAVHVEVPVGFVAGTPLEVTLRPAAELVLCDVAGACGATVPSTLTWLGVDLPVQVMATTDGAHTLGAELAQAGVSLAQGEGTFSTITEPLVPGCACSSSPGALLAGLGLLGLSWKRAARRRKDC